MLHAALACTVLVTHRRKRMQLGHFAIFYEYPAGNAYAYGRVTDIKKKVVSLAEPSSTYPRKRFDIEKVLAVVETEAEAIARCGKANDAVKLSRKSYAQLVAPAVDLNRTMHARAQEHAATGAEIEDPFPRNIRIAIGDLVDACRDLGDVHVVAAGAVYATLACTPIDCKVLSVDGINWQYD